MARKGCGANFSNSKSYMFKLFIQWCDHFKTDEHGIRHQSNMSRYKFKNKNYETSKN